MDIHKLINSIGSTSCVMSVARDYTGKKEDIRIVDANEAYKKSIILSAAAIGKNIEFVPGSPYAEYFPSDRNFDEHCYRCAVLGQPMHSYVHPERMDIWINNFMIPLDIPDEKNGYLLYTNEISATADTNILSDLSVESTSSVLKTCIKLHGGMDFGNTMKEVITDVRSLCGASHCCILMTDFDNEECSVLCEDYAEDNIFYDPENRHDSGDVNKYFYRMALSWRDMIGGSDCFIIQNENDMKLTERLNPEWYKSLREFKVNSLVLFPMWYNDKCLGYIWANNFDVKNTPVIKETLELTTYFLASEIANHKLLRQLKQLSTEDALTGTLNRNAMNNRVDEIVSSPQGEYSSLGIVFADVNGLKRVNDIEGHNAGDRLLKNSAKALHEVFDGYEIYRAGGDEFMIIAVNTTREDFNARVKRIRDVTLNPGNVCFAAGGAFYEKEFDIRTAMHVADGKMYEDKEHYYRIYPEMRYR